MDFLYHSIFKDKLKEFGFDNPTFEDLYLFAESNNINCVIDELDGKWLYRIYCNEYVFDDCDEYDNLDECELDMFRHLITDLEFIMGIEEDWYYTLTDEQRKQIERGLEDVKNGRVVPHEEVMKQVKELFK